MNRKKKIIEDYIIHNKDKLYRIAYTYVRNRDDALDIVQESVLKAYKKAYSIKNTDSINTWYCKILTNTALDYIRKNKKVIPSDNLIIENEGVCDKYEDTDLKRALESLNSDLRIIVVLRFFEDMKLKEISEVTGENLNTVKTKLYKALKILKLNIMEVE